MTTLLQSLRLLVHSENRLRFYYSVFAVLLWMLSIALILVSSYVEIPFGDLLVTALLAVSALLAITSAPRRNQDNNQDNKEPLSESDSEQMVNH